MNMLFAKLGRVLELLIASMARYTLHNEVRPQVQRVGMSLMKSMYVLS